MTGIAKNIGLTVALSVGVTGCTHPTNPFLPTPKLLFYSFTHNQEGAKKEAEAQQQRWREYLKIPDQHRPVNHSQAILLVKTIPEVRDAKWLNRSTLLLLPNPGFRFPATLDTACHRLETIGDSRWVIVAVETYGENSSSLRWENCRMPHSEVALGVARPPKKW